VCPIDKIVYVYVKGSNAQLTNSPLVYKQTLSALDLITDELMEWEDQWKPLGQSLILKLAISAFRNGDMIRKILALKVLVSLLKNFGPSNFLKASFRNCHSFYSHPVKVDVKR
jgi:hypothetical protein